MGEALNIGAHIFLFITLYFEVFLFMTFLETDSKAGQKKRATTRGSVLPFVSIAVPCYNEEHTLTRTITSLLALEYPKDRLEILIIDDGSTDKTWEVMQGFRTNPLVKMFQKENGGKHTALNLAIEKSKGDIFGCLDADSFVAPDALLQIVHTFENPEIMAVTPAMSPVSSHTIIQKLQKAEYSLSVFFRKCMGELNGIFVTPGPFSFFRKEVFKKLGVYRSAHNTEDLEMALRLQKHHYRIANTPQAHVYTSTPKTVRALHRQRLRWVYGFIRNAFDYRELFFKREYGNLGLLILPGAAVSIFSALYLTGTIFYRIGSALSRKFVEVQTVGISAPSFEMPNWFFFNTDSYIFLAITIIGFTTILMLIGKRLTEERVGFPSDILWYLSLYGFIAPFWLGRAVYRAVRSAPTDWAAERRGV
jgi:biofilm PGA synthesis N-glycosyltransferase PgaC